MKLANEKYKHINVRFWVTFMKDATLAVLHDCSEWKLKLQFVSQMHSNLLIFGPLILMLYVAHLFQEEGDKFF